jgi:tRNA (guanine-N7-)-methyltransferase
LVTFVKDDKTGRKRLATYGRSRSRKLRPAPARLMQAALPQKGILLPENGEQVSLEALMPGYEDIWLEIGFGGGEHLAHLAASHPGVGFIGCEPFEKGVASLLGHIEARKLENIKILQGDARELLERLGSGTLARVYIFHPDPWPKTRHHKRRLISPEFLTLVHGKLKDKGVVKLATDWPDYANWMLEHFLADPRFRWTAQCARDWARRFPESCETRYEAKARREGRKPVYLEFRKIECSQ